jgi:hypothetical protein
MRLSFAVLALVAACAPTTSDAPPPARSPATSSATLATSAAPEESSGPVVIEPPCLGALYTLKLTSAPPHGPPPHKGIGIAPTNFEAGQAAYQRGEWAKSAQRFVDCARVYRTVPDNDRDIETAKTNAEYCYANAILAYAAGALLESEGRAVLTKAQTDDPRMRGALEARLSKARDCPKPQPPPQPAE